MNKSFRLSIDSRESGNLINYLADSSKNSGEPGNLCFLIAKSWANSKVSIHVHGDLRIGGESETHQLCWMFMRERLQLCEADLDWLDILWEPSNYFYDPPLVGESHTHQYSSVLIDVRHERERSKNIFPGLGAIGLCSIPRLRLLDDCPCVPVCGNTIQGTAFFKLLRRRFDFVNEITLGLKDREGVGILWLLAFPEHELPNEMVEHRSQIGEEIPRNQRPLDWKFRKWASQHDVPFAVTAEICQRGLGVLLSPSDHFVVERVEVYLCPPEFGSDTTDIGVSFRHELNYDHEQREIEDSENPKGATPLT